MTYTADPRVDAYIDALPDWQKAACREARELCASTIANNRAGGWRKSKRHAPAA